MEENKETFFNNGKDKKKKSGFKWTKSSIIKARTMIGDVKRIIDQDDSFGAP